MYLPCVSSHPDRQDFAAVHEEDQAQELAVDAARGRHERRQESHVPVAAICVTIIADLVGSGALEDVVRVVGVAELALMLPYLTSADEIVAQGDVHQQIGPLRHADDADFEIGATSVITNALQRPQGMVVHAGPIRSMMEAGVDVVSGTLTTHKVPLAVAWHVRKRSEGRVFEIGTRWAAQRRGPAHALCCAQGRAGRAARLLNLFSLVVFDV